MMKTKDSKGKQFRQLSDEELKQVTGGTNEIDWNRLENINSQECSNSHHRLAKSRFININ